MDSLVPARLISYLKRVTKHLFVNVVCHVETILLQKGIVLLTREFTNVAE